MAKADDLIQAASAALPDSDEVLAAGIFGLQDDYAALTVAGVATGATASALDLGPVGDGVATGAALHATRDAVAASKGLTERMLVAVTPTRIRVLAWEGGEPGRVLLDFDRASTTVQITKFGLSRHLNLADTASDLRVGLTGSTAFFSAEAAGDKLVLHLLSEAG